MPHRLASWRAAVVVSRIEARSASQVAVATCTAGPLLLGRGAGGPVLEWSATDRGGARAALAAATRLATLADAPRAAPTLALAAAALERALVDGADRLADLVLAAGERNPAAAAALARLRAAVAVDAYGADGWHAAVRWLDAGAAGGWVIDGDAAAATCILVPLPAVAIAARVRAAVRAGPVGAAAHGAIEGGRS